MNNSDPSRTRILDAAARQLRTRGLTGAKLADIAQLAGMLAPSLYHHFPSKDHLVEEVMMEGIYRNTRFIVSKVEVLGNGASPLDRLRVAIKSHIDYLLTGDDYSSAVARVFDDLPDDMRRRVLAAYSSFDNYWRDLIAEVQRDGAANRDLDATVVGKFLIAMLNSCSSWYRPGKLTPTQFADQAAELVIQGFAVR